MSDWQKTCTPGTVCFDAVDNKFVPGDSVAYIMRGHIHYGKVHKINVNECGQIFTCWITPDEKFIKQDASRKSIYKYGPWYKKKSWYGNTYRTRDVIEKVKTQFYDDCLIPVSKIIKIVKDDD